MSSKSHSAERTDVYTRFAAEIVAAIEAGACHGTTTARPSPAPENISSGKRYRGVKVLALWIASQAHGYADGLWDTYRQWLAAGAQVRRSECGTTVVL